MLFRLGEIYEARGDRARAAERYGQFVELWKGADPELQPRVTEAQASPRGTRGGAGRPMSDVAEVLAVALGSHYRIERELGRGGMGTGCPGARAAPRAAAWQSRCCRRSWRRPAAPRFLRESEVAAQLPHPHIVPLLDAGEARRASLLRDAVHRRRDAPRAAGRGRRAAVDGRCDRARSPGPRPTRTRTASCTATSSRRTSCFRAATRSWRISASHNRNRVWMGTRATSGSPRRG